MQLTPRDLGDEPVVAHFIPPAVVAGTKILTMVVGLFLVLSPSCEAFEKMLKALISNARHRLPDCQLPLAFVKKIGRLECICSAFAWLWRRISWLGRRNMAARRRRQLELSRCLRCPRTRVLCGASKMWRRRRRRRRQHETLSTRALCKESLEMPKASQNERVQAPAAFPQASPAPEASELKIEMRYCFRSVY